MVGVCVSMDTLGLAERLALLLLLLDLGGSLGRPLSMTSTISMGASYITAYSGTSLRESFVRVVSFLLMRENVRSLKEIGVRSTVGVGKAALNSRSMIS